MKSGEVSMYNYRFVYFFPFSSVHCASHILSLLSDVYILELLFLLGELTHYYVIYLYNLSDINIATLVFFWLIFVWHIFFIPRLSAFLYRQTFSLHFNYTVVEVHLLYTICSWVIFITYYSSLCLLIIMLLLLSHVSHVWLFMTQWTVAHQAPLSMGFSRQEYWSGLSFGSYVSNLIFDMLDLKSDF